MIEVRTYEDVYPAMEELIDELRSAGFDESATILSHRMHKVARTSGSELWAELVRVLSDLEATEDSRLSPPLVSQVRAVLAKMREWFATFYPRGLDRDEDHPERLSPYHLNRVDFYLASSEGYGMRTPRACTALKRLHGEKREDLLLLNIDPPIIGQRFGLGERNIDHVIVATRFEGDSLFPIARWPAHVHVARLLVAYEGQEAIGRDEMESVALAELYPTEEAAYGASGG